MTEYRRHYGSPDFHLLKAAECDARDEENPGRCEGDTDREVQRTFDGYLRRFASEGDYHRAMADHELERRAACIPPRFRRVVTDEPMPDHGAYIYGSVGVGKTHLCAAWCVAAIRQGATVGWLSVPAWLASVRQSFNDSSVPVSADDLIDNDLIVLDDLGAERTTDWVREQLLVVVDALYNAERQVFVTSNVRLSDLARQVGAPTASRLAELCVIRELTGNDRRIVAALEYNRREGATSASETLADRSKK